MKFFLTTFHRRPTLRNNKFGGEEGSRIRFFPSFRLVQTFECEKKRNYQKEKLFAGARKKDEEKKVEVKFNFISFFWENCVILKLIYVFNFRPVDNLRRVGGGFNRM